MSRQGFNDIIAAGLLRDVEEIVVGAYRQAHPGASHHDAYHWLHYEDPDPMARLIEGVRRLRQEGAKFDAEAVDKACAEASKRGF